LHERCLDGIGLRRQCQSRFRDRLARKPEPQRAGWLAWLRLETAVPAFAAIVLAVVAGYQAKVTIPAMRAPQEIAAAVPLDDATRSAPPALEQGRPLHFEIAVAPEPGTTSLWVELVDASGKMLNGVPSRRRLPASRWQSFSRASRARAITPSSCVPASPDRNWRAENSTFSRGHTSR